MADVHRIIRRVFGVGRKHYKNTTPVLVNQPREKLAEVFRDCGYTIGAEVGVRRGQFSKVICEVNPSIEMHCVDIWDLWQDQYQHRRGRYFKQAKVLLSGYNVEFHKAASLDAVREFEDNSLDFVYIDAAHDFDNCVQDIIQWSAKVKSGGIVGCHDYFRHHYGGVVPAVDAYVESHKICPWYVTYELMPTAFWVKP